ncbi:hypothetical protein CYMTET_45816 [Cymbomonas tetramitiformis]|uniref:PCIF1 WW domain-containing protein n=1 Tax=Cymbomonas tetramitiformis TaxID=36881 RepID=A0AAE0BXF8_9CHLO|nr:hypothetical protein CYMTET_45816 [Cymbomonas tetramitiformis]
MKHRKKKPTKPLDLSPEMMEAVHEAMGARTEVFASPINVHKNTKPYYSQYLRDSVFGAMSSAWEAQWEKLGAYQFKPEYTAEDLYRALKKAINATKTAEPVLGRHPEDVQKTSSARLLMSTIFWFPEDVQKIFREDIQKLSSGRLLHVF